MRPRSQPAIVGLAALLAILSACSSADGSESENSPIQIAPASPELAPGESVQFTASARTQPGESVEWAVVEASGGSIDANGHYTAPGTEGTYTVTASLPSVGALQATAVHVTRKVRVGVSPSAVTLAVGESVALTASVTGPVNTVTWSVGDPTAGGTVTAAGVYTAPSTAGVYTVVATSTVDPTRMGAATITVTSLAPPPATTGTGTSHAPSYVAVTGGGPMPSTVGAVTAACAGDGVTDDTSCLRNAAEMARSQAKPLLIPAASSYYRISGPITVYGSVIGVGDIMPTIKQTSICSSSSCVGLRLASGMSGWIYNLHLIGAYANGARGEFAHNISIGGVNGLTIKGNLLENSMGDAIADNAQEDDGSAAARNVLIDGNTLVNPARCAISLVNVSDRWAIMNNVIVDDAAWVSTIDLEPWRTESYITNVEIGYNEITTPANPAETQAGNYIGVVTVSGWFDPSPGADVWVHHNWGDWPFANFVAKASNAGAFGNVVDLANVRGTSPST